MELRTGLLGLSALVNLALTALILWPRPPVLPPPSLCRPCAPADAAATSTDAAAPNSPRPHRLGNTTGAHHHNTTARHFPRLNASHPPEMCDLPRQPGLYFIDLGANCGNSYALFLKRLLPGLSRPDRLRAFLFEFNPRMHSEYLDYLEAHDPRVRVVRAAAHVADGNITAYLDLRKETAGQYKCVAREGAPSPAGASTLVGAMPRAGPPIQVAAVDFPAFLARTVCSGDEVHLKVDIEGFEYPLLGDLITRRLHCLVTEYYIEFHTKLPWVLFLGRNVTPAAATAEAQRLLRQCALVHDWF
jgi:FkbM family methyltransferase